MALTGLRDLMRGKTYVEVRLVTPGVDMESEVVKNQRTQTVKGNYPDWNETLEFKIHSKGEKLLTEKEIINQNTTLYFSVFDQCTTTKKVAYTNKYETIVENKFLGSISVGLVSVLQNSPKMEGLIRLDRPLDLQGYDLLTQGMFGFNLDEHKKQRETQDSSQIPTYLNLTVSTEPQIALEAENQYEYYPGKESMDVLLNGSLWVKQCTAGQFKDRVVKVFGEDIKSHSNFLCRYLRPQKPPIEIAELAEGDRTENDTQHAIQWAARFVSLIPFLDDNAAFDNLPVLWCTSQEFLDLGFGDYEEHAILLCNYFNYIDDKLNRAQFGNDPKNKEEIESFLIMGKAVPEGYTTYVLRRYKRSKKEVYVEIWNAIKGQCVAYNKSKVKTNLCGCLPISAGFNFQNESDPTCQLREVGCVIGTNNIWANVQKHTHPALIEYDLENRSHWKPFLTPKKFQKLFQNEDDKDTYMGLERIQAEEPIYIKETVARENLSHLEDDIKTLISRKFADARINH